MGIYLPKVNNENSGTRCVICSKLTKKNHTGTTSLTWRHEEILTSLLCLYCWLWKDSTPFLSIHSWISRIVAGWVYQQRSKYRQVKIMKHETTDANYAILTKRVKLQHEKKPLLNISSMQSVGFEQTFIKFIEIFVPQEQFIYRKKHVVETISLAITDSSDVRCLDLHLINIFTNLQRQRDARTLRSSWHFIVYLLLMKI